MAKSTYSTGEVARICKISQQTVIRCFNDGDLRGFLIPKSRFRRIPRDSLIEFMQNYGIPVDALEDGQQKVLIAATETKLIKQLTSALDADGHFAVRNVNNGFDAAAVLGEYHPELIILDTAIPDITCKDMCLRIRSNNAMYRMKIICFGENLRKNKITELQKAGANDYLTKPLEISALISSMYRLLDIKKEDRMPTKLNK